MAEQARISTSELTVDGMHVLVTLHHDIEGNPYVRLAGLDCTLEGEEPGMYYLVPAPAETQSRVAAEARTLLAEAERLVGRALDLNGLERGPYTALMIDAVVGLANAQRFLQRRASVCGHSGVRCCEFGADPIEQMTSLEDLYELLDQLTDLIPAPDPDFATVARVGLAITSTAKALDR